MGKRGPKKGQGGRPRKETDELELKVMRKFWREQKRNYREKKAKSEGEQTN